MSITSWKSSRLKRKTMNTLSAECQGLIHGLSWRSRDFDDGPGLRVKAVKVHWTSLLHRSSGPKEQMSLGCDLGAQSRGNVFCFVVLLSYRFGSGGLHIHLYHLLRFRFILLDSRST